MAYSDSLVTVERMLDNLQPLLENPYVRWRVAPGRARWFAYRVREALRVARRFGEKYPDLARLEVRVQVSANNEVLASPRASLRAETSSWEPSAPEGHSASAAAVVETEAQASSVSNIIERWQLGAETKLYFPKANLEAEGLLELYEWAGPNGVIFFENSGALTLMPYSEDYIEFAWTPADLEKE